MLATRRRAFASGEYTAVLWWVLIPTAVAAPFLLYGLYRWAFADPGIDAEVAKERFRAEQEWRSAHRSGNDNNAA